MAGEQAFLGTQVPASLKAQLRAIAEKEHRTLSNLVRCILQSAVNETAPDTDSAASGATTPSR